MPVPAGLEPHLADYLQALEDRVWSLEEPQQPGRVYACTTANMPDAAQYIHCVLYNQTLNILASSNGTAWIRQDTGAVI